MSGRTRVPAAAQPRGWSFGALANLPNAISVLRLALVPVTLTALISQAYGTALLAFAVAGISDALDGFLARKLGQETAFGRLIDPAADKLLLVGTTLALGWLGLLPIWLVALVVGRDLLIVAAVSLSWMAGRQVAVAPSRVSKANTVAQLLLNGTLILGLATGFASPLLHTLLTAAVTVLTSASAILYAVTWWSQVAPTDAKAGR